MIRIIHSNQFLKSYYWKFTFLFFSSVLPLKVRMEPGMADEEKEPESEADVTGLSVENSEICEDFSSKDIDADSNGGKIPEEWEVGSREERCSHYDI